MSKLVLQANTLGQAAQACTFADALLRQADYTDEPKKRKAKIAEGISQAGLAARFLLDFLAERGVDVGELIEQFELTRAEDTAA